MPRISSRRPNGPRSARPGHDQLVARARKLRRASPRQPAEGRARHQARPAGIVVEEQPADHLARRIEAWNDPAVKTSTSPLWEILRPPNVKVTPVVT